MTTVQSYTSADGRLLTTCGGHRTLGYAVIDGQWACRLCGDPATQHESTDDTIARLNLGDVLRAEAAAEVSIEGGQR